MSNQYSLIEKYRSLSEEIEQFLVGGNPIPIWFWAIIAGLTVVGGGIAIWQFYKATQPIVQSIQDLAPMIATAFAVLMNILAFLPFFFIFFLVMSLLGVFR